MVDDFLQSILRVLGSIWRIMGAPRVVGDERAYTSVKTAWENRAQYGEVGSGWSRWVRITVMASLGVLVAALLIWGAFTIFRSEGEGDVSSGPVAPTPFAGPEYVTEVSALSLALAAARENGLVSQDFSHIARRITFGEYAEAIGESDRAERGLLETDPETEIWAFGFAGDIELELKNGEFVEYDNLTVVLDALTEKVYRVEAFYGDYESEARAPNWLRPPTPTPVPVPSSTPTK
jgi:hypothetical protein